MSYMSRVYMAASVAVVKTHSDQGHKFNSALRSLNHGRKCYFSGGHGGDMADFRPLSGVVKSWVGGLLRGGNEQRKQTEESLRQVMYLNCWGQS